MLKSLTIITPSHLPILRVVMRFVFPALTITLTLLAWALLQSSAPSSAATPQSIPGPCEAGYVAPTPASVAVSDVPIEVTSTSADYFVLYIKHIRGAVPFYVPISVTLGEDGKTTLTDNLKPLSADRYRVEKYQIAQPGDLDGDCVDDVVEQKNLGARNPLNAGESIDISVGRVAIDSHTTFKTLSYQGDWSTGILRYLLPELKGQKYVKFWILKADTDKPIVYFQNTNNHLYHDSFGKLLGLRDEGYGRTVTGELAYHPNAVASNGSLGVYRYQLEPSAFNLTDSLWMVEKYNEILASAMPVLDNNLGFYINHSGHIAHYRANQSKVDASRIDILLEQEVLPDVSFTPLNEGEGYGRLRLMEEDERPGPRDIAIYKTLPNDLPRVAGTITVVQQTPLSHVNLRAMQNGLPNAFIRDALKDDAVKALIGSHVYYAVTADGYTIRAATKSEVDAHYNKSRPAATQTLQRDLTVKQITALKDVSFDDWAAFGVKAANMAELSKLGLPDGTVPVGFAVPFYFYDEFMKANDLYSEVDEMLADSDFQSDYDEQENELKKLRKKIKKAKTPTWIITALEKMHATYSTSTSLRYRSSTNNEDLPSFNGAGLYDSKTQDPDETDEDGIDKSIKGVWASLWNYRAFLERDFHRVDHKSVAMGVLVHPNFSDERVNGVAVSYDPVTHLDDMYYVNSQVGEDLVTNPDAYSQPEQLLLDSSGAATVLSRSNLATSSQLLMTDAQMKQLRNNLKTIHDRFATLYEVKAGDDYAIEIEFKITSANKLAIKQARPWIFTEPLIFTPTVTVSFASTPVTEGTALELEVARAGGALSVPLTVDLAWSETGQMLGASPPASVTIPSNQARTTLIAPIVDDAEDELASVITVNIGASGEYTIGNPASATATVEDDDLPAISARAVASKITEGEPAVFEFTRIGIGLDQPLTVNVKVSETGDTLDSVATTSVVSFAANAATTTLSLDTVDDTDTEKSSVVKVQISDGIGYSVASPASAAVTVQDDEPSALPGPRVSVATDHSVPDRAAFAITIYAWTPTEGAVSMSLSGPDAGHFYVYDWVKMLVFNRQSYDFPSDANGDGVYEVDVTVSDSLAGSTTIRLYFTVTSDELIAKAQAKWDALSLDERAAILPDAERSLLAPSFTELQTSVKAAVLRLARQNKLSSTSAPVATATTTIATSTTATTTAPTPEVSITGGDSVTEGGSAVFTLNANPAPTSDISVKVTVSQSGDFGVTTGSQTVTIPANGTSTLSVPTIGDSVDEPDGSVTATLESGGGYTISSGAGAATVSVADDDDPPGYTPPADLVANVRSYIAETHLGQIHVNRWKQVLMGLGVETYPGLTAMKSTEAKTYSDKGWKRWDPVVTELKKAEDAKSAATPTATTTPKATPVISVIGGSGVTEGGDAVFTLSASPAPASDLSVKVTVSQSGDYGVATGAKTVTIGTGGSATLSVPTTGDSLDEPDGSVTATINSGGGYTISGTQGAATVSVADDDVPEISVSGGSGVTEGDDAVFTLSASPAPHSNLSVKVTVSQSGDYGVATGAHTVTVGTGGSATLTVATTGDSADEPDGSVTATINAGNGYTISGSQGAATVSVEDDDVPVISVSGGSGVTEGDNAVFTLSASPAPASDLSVKVTVSQSGNYGVAAGAQTVTI